MVSPTRFTFLISSPFFIPSSQDIKYTPFYLSAPNRTLLSWVSDNIKVDQPASSLRRTRPSPCSKAQTQLYLFFYFFLLVPIGREFNQWRFEIQETSTQWFNQTTLVVRSEDDPPAGCQKEIHISYKT